MFGCDSKTRTHKTMSKFNSVFKSLDGLKVVTANTEAISKAVDVSVASTPVTRPVYSAAATQRLSKSLREAGSTGFWHSVKDRRYDDVIVATLSKSGATDEQVSEFMASTHGEQLGATLHSGIAKSLGVGIHVKRMFNQWTQRDVAKSTSPVLRKSATEEVIAKYGTSEGARKGAETKRSYGTTGQTDAQIAAEERRYDGPKPTKEQEAVYDAADASAKQIAAEAYQKLGNTEAERKAAQDKMVADSLAEGTRKRLALEEQYRRTGRIVLKSNAGFIASSFIAKGAVVEKSYRDKEGVERVNLKSTVNGHEVLLDMRKETVEKVASGEIVVDKSLNPQNWTKERREEFGAVNGYKSAAEIESKHGKDSEVYKTNEKIGVQIEKAWALIRQAEAFPTEQVIHKSLLYKAERLLKTVAVHLSPKLAQGG